MRRQRCRPVPGRTGSWPRPGHPLSTLLTGDFLSKWLHRWMVTLFTGMEAVTESSGQEDWGWDLDLLNLSADLLWNPNSSVSPYLTPPWDSSLSSDVTFSTRCTCSHCLKLYLGVGDIAECVLGMHKALVPSPTLCLVLSPPCVRPHVAFFLSPPFPPQHLSPANIPHFTYLCMLSLSLRM